MSTHPATLTQFIHERQHEHPEATGDFTTLLNAIGLAGKIISREVSRAGLVEILGLTGQTNVQGEQVQKLDVFSNNLLINTLGSTGLVCAMGSEEEDRPVPVKGGEDGRYVVLFDPLDGSSNIDVCAPIGTIFSIYRRKSSSGTDLLEDMLQPGRDLAAAGYVIYGSSTMLTYTTGNGVHIFTLDPGIGEFLLTEANHRDTKGSKVYSTNEGNSARWFDGDRSWAEHVKSQGYSARYIGSLVADFHRNLLRGGIFTYPGDRKGPEGKLRLLYECAPLAFVMEQAGGKATDGKQRILDIVPAKLHQRTPLYIGSAAEVDLAMGFVREGAAAKSGR